MDDGSTMTAILTNLDKVPISEKLRQLLHLARKIQVTGKEVQKEDITATKKAGANDEEIHNTILNAAAFCMYNRYVHGLGTTSAATH